MNKKTKEQIKLEKAQKRDQAKLERWRKEEQQLHERLKKRWERDLRNGKISPFAPQPFWVEPCDPDTLPMPDCAYRDFSLPLHDPADDLELSDPRPRLKNFRSRDHRPPGWVPD